MEPTLTNNGQTAYDKATDPYSKTIIKRYEADYAATMATIRNETVKRTMIQRRLTTGVNISPELQLPQRQIPQYIFARSAYDNLCSQLNTNNTRLQLLELAKTLGVTLSNKSKLALCQAIAANIGL